MRHSPWNRPALALPSVLGDKSLLWGRSDVPHWEKISFHFFSYDAQHVWQDTHQVRRGKSLKCPLANDKFCQIMCPPDTLEIFCSYFMCRVKTPGVHPCWNKDPPEVVFLYQFRPSSVGVGQCKAHPKFKKQGQPFCKMKWHAYHTVIWQSVPSKEMLIPS